jgi:ribonucleoside-diphosphate reductase beta chain
MRQYLEYVADQRLAALGHGLRRCYGKQPVPFMELQDVQELTNFFERRGVAPTRSASNRCSPTW